jgi:aryl-alcohol dehydrogenase-like predicted oxidoreductase
MSKADAYIDSLRSSLDKEDGKLKIHKVNQLTKIANDLNITVSQLSLAWCLKNQNVSSVILGATKISQLEENIGALEAYKLIDETIMKRIENVLQNRPDIDKDRH